MHMKILYSDDGFFFFLLFLRAWFPGDMVSSLLATALGVNRVTSVSDRWWRLPSDAEHVLFADVLKAKTRPPSCTLSRGQFSTQKDLRNPHIVRMLLPLFCLRGEATLECPLLGAVLCTVLCQISAGLCSTSPHISSSMFSKKKVMSNQAWYHCRLRSYQNDDEHNIGQS